MPHPFRSFAQIFSPCNGLLLLLLLLVVGCHRNDDEEKPSPLPVQTARRTVLIYMAAQNSLGYGGGALSNLKQDSIEIMAARQAVAEEDRLLFFIDDNRPPRIYEVTRDAVKPRLVKAWAKDVASTSPQTLQETLTWMKEQYPAEEYGLIMWSHADGWLPSTDKNYATSPRLKTARPFSFGIDDGSRFGSDTGSQMDISDMATAITSAGIHAKYIMFDACLMQNLEVAYALRNVADYIVASPIAIPASGGNYTHLVENGFFSNSPTSIVDTYVADVADPEQSDSYGDFGIVLSCLRTNHLQALADALYEALPHSTLIGRQSPDMSGVAKYQNYSNSYYYRPHNYDAAHAFERILPPEHKARVIAALNELIVNKGATESFWIGPGFWTYETVDLDNYCAVSAFIPQDIYTAYASVCSWGDLNVRFAQTEWYRAAGFAQTGW